MAAFGIVPTLTEDCRTMTFPSVFTSGGDFDVSGVSGATATAATLTLFTHDGATSYTVNVLSIASVATDNFTVSARDIVFNLGDTTRIGDGIWNARFDYTYDVGLNTVTESVCYYVPVLCALKGTIVCEAIDAIGDPDCISCNLSKIDCDRLELVPLFIAIGYAAECGLGYKAAELYEFLKQRCDNLTGCVSC